MDRDYSLIESKYKEKVMEVSKSEWKLFRSKIAGWQEAYMYKLNKEYIELLNGDGNPSHKFWKLDERIRKTRKSLVYV